jgi:SAM-dependent methyltransferase
MVDGFSSTKAAWDNDAVAGDYGRSSSLMPAELAVFAAAWPSIGGKRVLDIGVGGGRTLPYLSGPAAAYVAIDYSPAMVATCRSRFPGVDVRSDDARELASVGDHSVDFAFFSFNSIDYIPIDSRRSVYDSVRRVLAPGGSFGLSSHNLAALGPIKHKLPRVVPTANPLRLGFRLARAGVEAVRAVCNQRRLRKWESREKTHAVVNDGAYSFSMLTAYVEPSWQVAELERAGFADVSVFDQRGRRVDPDKVRDPWVHYLARKAA